MNDPKLKHAMAGLLPNSIALNGYGEYFWIDDNKTPFEIRETEWLYVMHLMEQTLGLGEQVDYAVILGQLTGWVSVQQVPWSVIHATFNQRATAMCKVKGFEV